MVKEFHLTGPFVVGLYCGSSKPLSFKEYLLDFISEMRALTQSGLEHNDVHYAIKLGAFICDAPARDITKYVKGHCGYYACERCTQEGVQVNGRKTFPEINAPLRTDDQSMSMIAEEHHMSVSPLAQLNVNVCSW
jgi:hypothetical protein